MKILQFKEIGTDYSRILSVTLRLTKKCNFSCNYCMEYDNNFENIFDLLASAAPFLRLMVDHLLCPDILLYI